MGGTIFVTNGVIQPGYICCA